MASDTRKRMVIGAARLLAERGLQETSFSEVLELTGLAKSRKEARRTVEQGASYVNNVQQSDEGRSFAPADLLHDRYLVLRKGKRQVHIVKAL